MDAIEAFQNALGPTPPQPPDNAAFDFGHGFHHYYSTHKPMRVGPKEFWSFPKKQIAFSPNKEGKLFREQWDKEG